MKLRNKSFRKFSLKVGGESKDLLPLSEIEIDKEQGEILSSSFPGELELIKEEENLPVLLEKPHKEKKIKK